MDPELKQTMQQVQNALAEQNKLKGAVQQLEEQMKGLPQTVENKIKAMRNVAWDGSGNYRGVMGSEGEARSFGLLCMARVGGDGRAASALKSEFGDIYERALGDSPEAGDNLVPIEHSSRIQRLVEDFGAYAADVMKMPMTSQQLTFQRRTKGVKVFKATTPSKSDQSTPEWDSVNLNAEDWHALVLYPKSLGEDAAAEIGELLAMEIAQGFSDAIDTYGFTGDGTPDDLDTLGITTRLVNINGTDDGGGIVQGSGANGAGWGGLVRDDFLKCVGRARHVRRGRWYVSNEFYWTVMAPIILSAGGTTVAQMENGLSLQAFGAPVRITPAMPRTEGNDQVAALYGDLRRSSTMGQRRQLMVEQSSEALFIERQVAVLGTQRMDINNHSLGDSSEAGPMVGLLTPAA